jgi:hypothetical protein
MRSDILEFLITANEVEGNLARKKAAGSPCPRESSYRESLLVTGLAPRPKRPVLDRKFWIISFFLDHKRRPRAPDPKK